MAGTIVTTEELFGQTPEILTTEQLFGIGGITPLPQEKFAPPIGAPAPKSILKQPIVSPLKTAIGIVPRLVGTIGRNISENKPTPQAIKEGLQEVADTGGMTIHELMLELRKPEAGRPVKAYLESLGLDIAGNLGDFLLNPVNLIWTPATELIGAKVIQPLAKTQVGKAIGKVLTAPIGKKPPTPLEIPQVISKPAPWEVKPPVTPEPIITPPVVSPPVQPEVTPTGAGLGRLNPEIFPEEIQPKVEELISLKPKETPVISDRTIQQMAEKMKTRPQLDEIIRLPEGTLEAQALNLREEVSQNIISTLDKSLVDLGSDISTRLDDLSRVRKVGTTFGRSLRQQQIEVKSQLEIANKIDQRIKEAKESKTIAPEVKQGIINGLNILKKEAVKKGVIPSLWDKLYYGWLNSILSSPITHARNTVGNILTVADKISSGIPTATIDATLSTIKGTPRTAYLGEVPAQLGGLFKGGKVPEEIMELATGSKVEMAKPISGIAGKIIGTPTELLGFEDDIFKNLIGRMELGRAKFLKGRGLLKTGKEELNQEIAQEILYRTFQNDPSKIAEGLMNARGTIPGIKYIIPFVRTPSNLLVFAMERSPFQAVNLLYKTIGKKYVGNQAMMAKDLANLATGSAVATWVAHKYIQGKVTGDAPRTPAERDAFYRQGKKPNSLLIGDVWFPLGNLDPLGIIFSNISNVIEGWEQGKEEPTNEKVLNIVNGLGKTLGTRTYLSGLTMLAAAIEDPDRFGKQFINRTITGVVPNIFKFAADLSDNHYRDTNNALEMALNKMPYLSKKLPAKVDVFGRPQMGRKLGITGAGISKISLADKILGDIIVPMPPDKVKGVKLTGDEVRWLKTQSGSWLEQKIASINPDLWNGLTDEGKQKIINTLTDISRSLPKLKLQMSYMKAGLVESKKPLVNNIVTTEELFSQP